MGLYSHGKNRILTGGEKIDVPFKVRNMAQINAELDESALPRDYTADYVVTFANRKDNSGDIQIESCPLAYQSEKIVEADLDYFMRDYQYLVDNAKPGTQVALNLTQEQIDSADSLTMSNYIDALISLTEEGIPVDMSGFTEETWNEARQICNTKIHVRMPEMVRKIYISRLLRKPLEILAYKVDQALN